MLGAHLEQSTHISNQNRKRERGREGKRRREREGERGRMGFYNLF
jgi:hypothetical protein